MLDPAPPSPTHPSTNLKQMSSTISPELFEALTRHDQQPVAMLSELIEFYRQNEQPMELFEAQKMLVRANLGLPLLAADNEPVREDEIEHQLESGLLKACRESGEMLIRAGRVFEGWTYLRPTGDNQLIREALSAVEITDDNFDEMQRVLLHEGVDVGRGFQAILDFQGTCNSITLFDQSLAQSSKADRQAAGACLLNHFYDELISLVREDITARDKAPADDETLFDMIDKRPWVLKDGGYHLDTTHLSSTVRIAMPLTDPELLHKAWELTQYGRQLNHQFQYPGDEPFVDFYPSYAAFYGILLGKNVDAGLKLFERKAKSVDTDQHGSGAIETYVDLLDRVGRHRDAIAFAVNHVPSDVPSQAVIPLLMEIAKRDQEAAEQTDEGETGYELIANFCRDRDDPIGFAVAKYTSSQSA